MVKIDGNGSMLDLRGLKGMKKDIEGASIIFIFEDTINFREYKHKYDSLAKMHQWYAMLTKVGMLMKVRCIDDRGISHNYKADGITKGKIYEVVEDKDKDLYVIINDYGVEESRNKTRFEKIKIVVAK